MLVQPRPSAIALAFLIFVAALPVGAALLPEAPEAGSCGTSFPFTPRMCPTWVAREDSAGGQDAGRAVVASPTGDLVFSAGHLQAGADFWDREALVVAHDPASGARVWSASVPSPFDGPNEFRAVATDAAGTRVFAVGSAHDGSDNVFRGDILVAAFDAADGALLWSATLDVMETDIAEAVAVSPDGTRVFAAGSGSGWESGSQYLVVGLDAATGDFVWTRQHADDAAGENDARDVALDEDGTTLFVTGASSVGSAPIDFLTLALDPMTGESRWSARYDGPASSRDFAAALAVGDGFVVVAGDSEGLLDPWGDVAVVGYDALTGEQVWETRYAGTGLHYDGASDVAITAGRAFVTGTVHNLAQPYVPRTVYTYTPAQPITMALDLSSGVMRWHTIEQGDDGITPGEGLAIAVKQDGSGVYVAGRYIPLGGSTDPLVLAYDGESGLIQWKGVLTSEPGIYDTAEGVALAPDASRLFVVGTAGDGEVRMGSGVESSSAEQEPHGDVLTLAFDL